MRAPSNWLTAVNNVITYDEFSKTLMMVHNIFTIHLLSCRLTPCLEAGACAANSVKLYDHYKHMLAALPTYLEGYVEHARTFLKTIDGNAHVTRPSVSIRVYNPDAIIYEWEFNNLNITVECLKTGWRVNGVDYDNMDNVVNDVISHISGAE